MKLFITFGQCHAHRVNGVTFDKDAIAAITCDDYADGRRIAFELFEGKFGTSHEEMTDRMLSFFPRGVIDAN